MGHIKNVCTLGELSRLEVINLCDGKKLGCVHDIEIDLCLGHITAILLPKKIELNEIFRKDGKRCLRIPWCMIERIGDDTILVRLEEVHG